MRSIADILGISDFGLWPRPAAASGVEHNMMGMLVKVVVKVIDGFEFGDLREQSSSDRLCL
jgi:hypothetical protein